MGGPATYHQVVTKQLRRNHIRLQILSDEQESSYRS